MNLPSLLFAIVLSSQAFAGTAAFLPDGKHVARAEDEGVMILDLATLKEAPLELPEGIELGYPVLAATESALLVRVKDQVMAWNPESKEWKLYVSAPPGLSLQDIAVDPKTGLLVMVLWNQEESMTSWWILEKGKTEPVHVANRRAEDPQAPVFDAAGTLYFCGAGDVWKGSIEIPAPDEETHVSLEASRIWPLAEKETANGTPSGVSAQGILPLKKYLAVERSRTGGSGWGAIVRVPNEDAYEKHLPLKWDEMQDSQLGANLALSRDGTQAMAYVRSAHRWFRVDVATGKLSEPSVPVEKKKK